MVFYVIVGSTVALGLAVLAKADFAALRKGRDGHDSHWQFLAAFWMAICKFARAAGGWGKEACSCEACLGHVASKVTNHSLLYIASDFLYGPHSFGRYTSLGLDLSAITILSIIGFVSTALGGILLGNQVDKHGRKKGALLQCICGMASHTLILGSEWWMLVVNRAMNGVGVSLMPSYENWLGAVSEGMFGNALIHEWQSG